MVNRARESMQIINNERVSSPPLAPVNAGTVAGAKRARSTTPIFREKVIQPLQWGARRDPSLGDNAPSRGRRYKWSFDENAIIGVFCERHMQLHRYCKSYVSQFMKFLHKRTEGAKILREYYHQYHTLETSTFSHFAISILIDSNH
jgi:hypothetical protein